MVKGYRLLVIGIALLLLAVSAAAVYYFLQSGEKENTILSTDGAGYAEEEIPHADPLIVGKWQNTSNRGWYKVYYDDYDEDEKLFWGKEWDENEDVTEEDLRYHGNGWFRWEKKRKAIHEYATMDSRDMQIHRNYTLLKLTGDSLVYNETDHKKILFRFSRVK